MQPTPIVNGQAEEALDRLTRLQAITASLSEALTSEQVADAILAQAGAVLGATAGVVYLLSDNRREFVALRMAGYPEEVAAGWGRFPADTRIPVADAVRAGRPVAVPCLAELRDRYPQAARFPTLQGEAAAVALPLVVRGRPIGAVGLRFPTDRTFSDQDLAFLSTLAGLCAQALDRARLFDAERAARQAVRAISDNLPSGAVYQVVGDAEGRRRYLYVSAGVERLFGVTPAEAQADAAALYSLVHEEDRPRVAAAEAAALRDAAPFDCEFRSWTRGGELRWVHCRSAPRRLPSGETAWEGIVIDVTDRKRAERRRAARLAVTQALADAATVDEAAPRLLQALCGGLGWDVGTLWRLDPGAPALRCVAVWHSPDQPAPEFAAATRRSTFARGVGLPGRVWASGEPAWIPDVVRDTNFPRSAVAAKEGLHGAFSFPLVLAGECLGAIEFFGHDVREPDADLMEMMATVSSQVGQFMERKRAEEELRRRERELADFFDNATLGLHWVGPDGTILRVNQAELDLLGYTREEYVGRHIAEFHADRGVIDDILRRLAAGEELRDCEARMRCKDGSIKHVLISSSVLWEDGRFVHTRCFTRDVTEQKRAADALRAGEERFARFMQHLPGLAWIKDAEGRYVYANDAAVAAFGTPRAGLYGKTDEEVFPPETAARFRENDRKALARGTGVQVVEALAHPDGTVHHSLVSKFPIPGPDGTAALVGGMAIDITEQRRTRSVLEESEERFRQLAENIQDVFWMSDPQKARIDYVSPAYEQVWGRSCQSLYEQPLSFFEAIHPEDREHVRANSLGRQGRGEPTDVEYRVVRPDGSERWVRDRSFPVKDPTGRVYRVTGIAEDITERKRMETALRRQNERLRLLWEAASVLLSTDEPGAMMRGLFAKIAPHFELDTYFNFMVDEAGQALRLESCIGIPEATARTLTRLEFGQAVCGTVALLRQPIVATYIQQSDNPKAQLVKSFGVRAYACNPLLAGDQLLGTLSFATRSRDEFDPEELDFLRTICRYVTAAYERLRLIRQLREADRRKDEFLATLAHELRNPLAPLRNGLQLLRLAGDDRAAAEQAQGMMERQLRQMVRLIDDLLDVSRITRGKLQLRRERVELASVVQSAVEGSRPLIDASAHRLAVALPPEPVWLDADPTRLAQVFANLLTNAAKYTDRGGDIRLTAEVASGGCQPPGEVVVSVRDSGIGIAPDHLPRLFEMFNQAAPALERSQGGLGIGLTLVKRLVELHGGTVQARSEGLGRGSEFVVRPPHRRRILVADDNRDAADSLALMLRLAGHEVHAVHDGQEAVEAAAWFRPDVAVLDIGMPRLNGYEACRRIREQPGGRGLVMVALTGWGQEEDKRRAIQAGFDHHLTKPVAPADLEELLRPPRAAEGA